MCKIQFVIYKYIVNSSITQFLGTVLETTMLSWKNHIDKLMDKLSEACYAIRAVQHKKH